MGFRLVLFLFLSAVPLFNAEATTNVWQAFYQRQYHSVKAYISQHNDVDAQLLDVTLKVMAGDKTAEKAVEALQKNHASNAMVFHKTANLWRVLAQQAGLLSKRHYYEQSIAAYIKAGDLAPDNARYRRDYARSKASNGSLFSVDLSVHRAAIDQMKEADPRYVLLAEMDYAQNSRDKKSALVLVQQAQERFADDIGVMERAGQLLWTNDEFILAQQFFAAVCQLSPGRDYLWARWLESCELSVMFAQKEQASLPIGLTSSQRIIDLDTVHDDYYADNLLVHAELLQKAGRRAEAITALERIKQLPASDETLEQTNKWLKKWTP